METSNLYCKIYSMKNLILAYKKARKGKTKKDYTIEFEKNLRVNLRALHYKLKYQIYKPKPLVNFILRDPKTRKISKSNFRDRIVHHALVRVIEPIFDKIFIYDSCANRIRKGSLFALKRFKLFKKKITNNLKSEAFCLKADIKHYFEEVDHNILIKIIERKIKDKRVIWLIKRILENNVVSDPKDKGMPLGNLTSQFFANVYLNELDHFVKHILKIKYYIRYVDDFIILDISKERLLDWEKAINDFLIKNLKLELHKQKSRIIYLSRGIDFVGFRNFWHFRLLRNRSVNNIKREIGLFNCGLIDYKKLLEIFQGWNAYAKWANTYKLSHKMLNLIKISSLSIV